jgi:hypothetical protein
MREACKFNVRFHNGNILMSSVTKNPGVSSILLFSGSGINFPRPLYLHIWERRLNSFLEKYPRISWEIGWWWRGRGVTLDANTPFYTQASAGQIFKDREQFFLHLGYSWPYRYLSCMCCFQNSRCAANILNSNFIYIRLLMWYLSNLLNLTLSYIERCLYTSLVSTGGHLKMDPVYV